MIKFFQVIDEVNKSDTIFLDSENNLFFFQNIPPLSTIERELFDTNKELDQMAIQHAIDSDSIVILSIKKIKNYKLNLKNRQLTSSCKIPNLMNCNFFSKLPTKKSGIIYSIRFNV
jgi:hypothetical protein